MKPTKLKFLTVLLLSVILGFLILALFTGCSAEQRYKRLIKNHPELVETDTVIVTDTIIREVKVRVPEYKDSFIFKHDTTYETKEVIVYKKGDKVFLNVKPKEIIVRDTVPFEVKVPGKVITITKTNWNLLWIILIVGLVLGLLLKSR
jgi:uncharacterized integral membrane protein